MVLTTSSPLASSAYPGYSAIHYHAGAGRLPILSCRLGRADARYPGQGWRATEMEIPLRKGDLNTVFTKCPVNGKIEFTSGGQALVHVTDETSQLEIE